MNDPMELVDRLDYSASANRGLGRDGLATLLTEAAACIREMVEWRPIETAPRDGTWIRAWREPPKMTGPRWEPLIYVRWDEEEESWVWPCDTFEVFTIRGRELADMEIGDGDYYSASDFTHWLPLPPAPGAEA